MIKAQILHTCREFFLWVGCRTASSAVRNWISRKVYGFSGRGIVFGRKLEIRYPSSVRVQSYTLLNDEFRVLGGGGCEIGKYVYTAPNVSIVTVGHEPKTMEPTKAKVIVEDFVWIGAGAWILPGVRIGKGAIVGAGAIVTKDVPEFTVVGGSPASPIGKREIQYPYRLPGGEAYLLSDGSIQNK